MQSTTTTTLFYIGLKVLLITVFTHFTLTVSSAVVQLAFESPQQINSLNGEQMQEIQALVLAIVKLLHQGIDGYVLILNTLEHNQAYTDMYYEGELELEELNEQIKIYYKILRRLDIQLTARRIPFESLPYSHDFEGY